MDMTDKDYRCITKSELADKCGISRSTLSLWLNCRYYVELKKLGYKKSQRILLPLQVKFLFEILVIIEE
jgi:hypothetical protein